MTAFLAIERYSPVLVLTMGLATFIGLWGLGTVILDRGRLRLSAPWNHVTALLLGIQTLSLTVRIVGMVGFTFPLVLSTIWWGMIGIGGAMVVIRWPAMPPRMFSRWGWASLAAITIVGAAVLANMMIAIAPSSKIDELRYHMLIPGRIVVPTRGRSYSEGKKISWQDGLAALWYIIKYNFIVRGI